MAVNDAGHAEPWQKIGATEYRFEPPDIVASRTRGVLTKEDAGAMFDFLRRRAAERRPLFWLHDNAHAPSPTAEVRKLVAQELRTIPLDGVTTFGGSFQSRILAKLAIQAVELLHPGAALPASFLAESEADARAWIAQRRRELAG